MFELLLIAIALVGTTLCGLWDLKTSNIPDIVAISMIVLGIGLHITNGFILGDFTLLMNSFFYGGIFLFFGLLMYYGGQWGGGDGELLVAIGFLLPNLALSFFLNLFLVGVVYSILYSIIFTARNPIISKKFFLTIKGNSKPLSGVLLLSIVLSIIFYRTIPILSILSVFLFSLLIFYIFAKIVEKEGFTRRIRSKDLKPDDMIGEDLKKLKIYKKLIRGLSKKEVRKIQKHKKYVVIKDGVRFGLVFPLTLIVTLIYGNILFMILEMLI